MEKFLKVVGTILALLLLVLLVWGLTEPYTLDEETYEVSIPALPAAWAGETIAVTGDLQVGMWLDNENTVQDAVEAIIAEDPAATFLIGDFVYHAVGPQDDEIDQVATMLAPLADAGIPTYAVLGNHDYGLARPGGRKREELAAAVAEALEGMGITVLQNEALILEHAPEEAPLYVVGVGSHYAGSDRPEVALSAVPAEAPRVVIMHNPDSFAEVPARSAALAVAGHTHGGQISIPYTPNWSLMTVVQNEDEVHADGWVETDYGAAGNRLYINRGIGMSVLPLRVFAQPELTFFRLQQAQGDTLPQPLEVD